MGNIPDLRNAIYLPLISIGLFFGILVLLNVGRALGKRRLQRFPEKANVGLGAVDGSVYGLLGLLIAFTFSGAAARFDQRRHIIVQEINCIGTAFLRIDLLPVPTQAALKEQLHKYTALRIQTYQVLPDMEKVMDCLAQTERLQESIWRLANAAVRDHPVSPAVTSLVMGSLNEMFDIRTTRTQASMMHPPTIIMFMLVTLMLISALLTGYATAEAPSLSWLHALSLATIMSLTFMIMIFMEYPRLGLMSFEAFDESMVELLNSMTTARP
ncbi:MAG TPA: hypothetical protein PKD86_06495 [Gemmatales bacterium]|nr:hypothetical protein [Gemmatales bacterium]HMP58986.1 hypothetical protein [Gemmatales bacterium]